MHAVYEEKGKNDMQKLLLLGMQMAENHFYLYEASH
jgi:hypothetical protein